MPESESRSPYPHMLDSLIAGLISDGPINNPCQIPPHLHPMIRCIGQHEVGHYVAAKVMGFRTGSISLTITDLNGGHRAGSEIIPACALSGDQNIIDYLERRVIVLFSGALAESLTDGKPKNELALKSLRSGGGVRDYDKARELIQLIRNLKYASAITESEIQEGLSKIDNELWNRATEIIKAEHHIVECLGSRLASGIKHTGQQFILNQAELESLPVIRDRFGG